MDTYGSFVWEPSLVKTNAITAATEAACLVNSCSDSTAVRQPIRAMVMCFSSHHAQALLWACRCYPMPCRAGAC